MISQKVTLVRHSHLGDGGTVTFGDPPVAETREIYTYNDLDILTSETKLDSTNGVIYQKTYQYDLAGNRTNTVFDGVTNIYTLGTGNKLSTWGTNGSMAYASAGNVTNITYQDGRSLGLAWNDRYEITSISTNGALAESFEYDALGRRVKIADSSSTNYLVYDGIHVIAEVGTSSLLVRSYSYGPGVDNILAMTVYGEATNTYYYLKDHLGSVVAITDETGTNVVERYEYDAWGNVTAFDGDDEEITESQIGNRYLWQGREYSWKTGLYNFRARWYDPVTGRWLSKDPIGISGGLNQYVFCSNNPIMFVDPLGLCEEGDDLPWYKKLGLSITLPALEGILPFWIGGGTGHEFIWIPGQGWRSYVYPQGGVGNPGGGIHLGIGPVFNITKHEDYLRHYINIGGMTPPTPYGSFGADVSFFPGSPTAVNFDWGLSSGGGNVMYQYYMFTKDAVSKIGGDN